MRQTITVAIDGQELEGTHTLQWETKRKEITRNGALGVANHTGIIGLLLTGRLVPGSVADAQKARSDTQDKQTQRSTSLQRLGRAGKGAGVPFRCLPSRRLMSRMRSVWRSGSFLCDPSRTQYSYLR